MKIKEDSTRRLISSKIHIYLSSPQLIGWRHTLHLTPLTAKGQRKQLAFKPNRKSSITHHAERNSMASPTQVVIGKGKPNSLITEGLLKILRDLILLFPLNFLTNSRPWNGKTSKSCNYFFSKIITDRTCHVNIIPLADPTVRLILYL